MGQEMKPAWWNLVIGLVSLLASFAWPYVEKLVPPFGSEMFVQIVLWVIGAVFAAIFGWNVKAAKVKTAVSSGVSVYTAGNVKPAWWNLFIGLLSLLASYVWPYVEKLLPPFGADMWVQIVLWVVGAVFAAIFGWNVKAAAVKSAVNDSGMVYGYRMYKK